MWHTTLTFFSYFSHIYSASMRQGTQRTDSPPGPAAVVAQVIAGHFEQCLRCS